MNVTSKIKNGNVHGMPNARGAPVINKRDGPIMALSYKPLFGICEGLSARDKPPDKTRLWLTVKHVFFNTQNRVYSQWYARLRRKSVVSDYVDLSAFAEPDNVKQRNVKFADNVKQRNVKFAKGAAFRPVGTSSDNVGYGNGIVNGCAVKSMDVDRLEEFVDLSASERPDNVGLGMKNDVGTSSDNVGNGMDNNTGIINAVNDADRSLDAVRSITSKW